MVKAVHMIRISNEGMELKLTFLAWKEQRRPTLGLQSLTGDCLALGLWWNTKAVIFQTCLLESPVHKTAPFRDFIIFERLPFLGINPILILRLKSIFPSSTSFDQSDDSRTKSKWLKSCFSLRIMGVCYVLLIRLITNEETCNHLSPPLFFFFFFFWRVVGKRVSRCWGSVRGSDMQGTRMVSTLYITVRLRVSLEAWSGGGSGRQSFVSLVAPCFWMNRFCSVREVPCSSFSSWEENSAVASLAPTGTLLF